MRYMKPKLTKTIKYCCEHTPKECVAYVRSRMTFTMTWRQLALPRDIFPQVQKLAKMDKAALMHAIASGRFSPREQDIIDTIERNRDIGRRLGLTPKEDSDSNRMCHM